MKNPRFWHNKNLISLFLFPLGYFYRLGSIVRNFFINPVKISKPVICIGNLTVGGAGKTPIALALGVILKEIGVRFAYLGHGYKAQIENLILVDGNNHENKDVGDEAILLSELSHTFISKNRVFAAQQIAKMPDEQMIIMDDGLQNPSIIKDLSILVIDGEYGFGNNFILPAGPLRQTFSSGIKKVDLVIIVGEDKFNLSKKIKFKKIINVKSEVTNKELFENKDLIAFCGIARPEKFFNTLSQVNCNIVKEVSFSDHYQYKSRDLESLIKRAQKSGAELVTTKKDWVRFDKRYKDQINYLDIEINFNDKDKQYLIKYLKELYQK